MTTGERPGWSLHVFSGTFKAFGGPLGRVSAWQPMARALTGLERQSEAHRREGRVLRATTHRRLRGHEGPL